MNQKHEVGIIAEESDLVLMALEAKAKNIQTLIKLRSTLTLGTSTDTLKKAERALNKEINVQLTALATGVLQRFKRDEKPKD